MADTGLHLSRMAVVRALATLVAIAYCAATLVILSAVEPLGGVYMWLARVLVVFGASFAAMMLMPQGRARSWLRLQLAKHLFRHRYDYRAEWLRFTHRLGETGGSARPDAEEAAPLARRIERALADITESPAALLLVPAASGRLEPLGAAAWPEDATAGIDANLARLLERSPRILDGDALRAATSTPAATEEERRLAPGWLIADASIWAAVPLVHGDRLTGLVLLARPAVDRRLDWEDHDLLSRRRPAGGEPSCRGARAGGAGRGAALPRIQPPLRLHRPRREEPRQPARPRRPQCRAARRQSRVPGRYGGDAQGFGAAPQRTARPPLAAGGGPRRSAARGAADAACWRRSPPGCAPASGRGCSGRPDLLALIDPARLELALGHLVQNAIEASPADETVCAAVSSGAATEVASP